MDGEILYENLLHSGKDEEWLKKQLSSHGCKRLSDVSLQQETSKNTLNIYLKNNRSGSSVIKDRKLHTKFLKVFIIFTSQIESSLLIIDSFLS